MKILQHRPIDYLSLSKACQYYTSCGFEQVEVPWIVNRFFSVITSPSGDSGCAISVGEHDFLVCSAEQGLIRQAVLNELSRGKALFAVSPCFRDEEHDETHSKQFVKLELFTVDTEKVCRRRVRTFADMAVFLFRSLGVRNPEVVETGIGLDVMADGLELGSYGVRNIMGSEWCTYGTGIALPRLSLAVERSE